MHGKFTAGALLVASLAATVSAQNHTVPEAINCGPDILVDDFSENRRAALPGETQIRDLNILGGDYGKSDGDTMAFTINTAGKYVELTPGQNASNFFFAKFDAGACYDLTNLHAVAFDLVAPAGSAFTMTLTQKNPDCVDRAPDGSDSSYIPLSKYITPNGQKQTVISPFADYKANLKGGAFDFVHLKDWTLVGLTPPNAKFQISNIRLIRACNDNGPTGKNTTTIGGTPTSSASPAPSGAPGSSSGSPSHSGSTPSSTNAGSGTGAQDAKTSSAAKYYGAAGLGIGTLIFAALAMF
jgi:hypothetical protein